MAYGTFLWGFINQFRSIFIGEIYCTNLKLEFELEYLFWILYIFFIFTFGLFLFFAIILAEYGFMTREIWNFIEESETQKAIRKH